MLFVELALIRWAGSNVVYLSYFSNFVLLGSFLGIGVGFLRERGREDLFRWAPAALAALVAFVLAFPVEIDRSGSELIYFGSLSSSGLPTWVMLPVIFLLVAGVMATIAQGVARTFARFEPLDAYRLDIAGSVLGVVGFTALSFLRVPPVAWGVVAALLFVLLLAPRVRVHQAAALAVLVGFLLVESMQPSTRWSPYYKVETERYEVLGGERLRIDVNGVPHQEIDTADRRRFFEEIYVRPYRSVGASSLDDVLIVGAGSGSDVAIALAEGARRIDAVEIDPVIHDIGRRENPDRPYDDPRVTVHIDDGRAFLERTGRRYDLILFALPDSITLVAGQSSLRLESYLFTEEAMEAARDHLKPGGAFGMYNYYRESWLVDRLARTLEVTYGRPPCIESVGDEGRLALLMASSDPAVLECGEHWVPSVSPAPDPATDDHPFLYMRDRGVPGFYVGVIALILLLSTVLVRATGGPLRPMARYLDLFFMGAAFLLLETKSVVQFALLFGTTWVVNALVFTGILLSVLAAVEWARRRPLASPTALYALLLAAVAVAWAVPQQELLALPTASRFAAATVLAFAPIFLANLVFSQRFRDVESSTAAFGANLLGAMVGGLLEYLALVTGYRALLVVVAALYCLAYVFGRRHLTGGAVAVHGAPAQPATVPGA